MQFDAFISHSSRDKLWAEKLKLELDKRGLRAWLADDEIRPGDHFAEALEVAIEGTSAVVIIVSVQSLQSNWVKTEIRRAQSLAHEKKRSVRIIPILIDDVRVDGFLGDLQPVYFQNSTAFSENINRLIWGITG